MEEENKKLIFIIEDETPLLLAIQKKLKNAGFDTLTAKDGKQALDYLMSLDRLPDLIWLDYYLPTMNGLEFLSRVKKNKKFENIPVVVVSNTAGPEKVNAMMALGVEQYYVKAEKRLDEIIKEINSLMN
jgi:two-component system phosphate regulon response regulator PhoB